MKLMKSGKNYPAKRKIGFTLIEILIALAVLSIGLAGLAAMQLSSMQFVHSAHYRSMASAIALDFEERLWIAVADDTLTGCPSHTADDGTTLDALIDDWARSNGAATFDADTAPRLLSLPDMTVTVGTVVENTSGSPVKLIPLTFSWGEARFSDREGTSEQFTYNVRILCRQTS